MADIETVLRRLRWEFLKVNILQAGLDALIAFLALDLALFLSGTRVFPATSNTVVTAGIGTVVFLVDVAYRFRRYRLTIYEERNPELREILRTARDNPGQDTFPARAMAEDLLDRLRRVTSDSIIPSRILIQKILVVGALSFLTLLSGVTDFRVARSDVTLLPSLDQGGGDGGEPDGLRNASGIYGERSDIQAADLALSFNITGSGEGEPAGEAQRGVRATGGAAAAVERALGEDLALAERYSLAVRRDQ